MRKRTSRQLIGLVVVALAACGETAEPAFKPYVYQGVVPWDGGCPDPGVNCPGQVAFECGMTALQLNHARCQRRNDCIAAKGPDPADCYSMCGHAPINRNEETAYLAEAKEEVFKYCNRARCTAYLHCPRPDDAELDCVDGGVCAWVEGVFRFPDAGRLDAGQDAGAPLPGPDAAAPAGLDAAAPGLDAAPPGLDAAPPGLDAAPPGLDAAPPGLDAAEPGLDAAPEPPDADAEPPDAD